MKLYAPPSFYRLSKELRKEICNGCGSKGFGGWIVPNTLWGLNVEDCCDIHDYMYHIGKTIEDKEKADRVMLNNMMRKIEAGSKWLRWVRRERAASYYYAVKLFGGNAFWSGKNG